MGCCCSSPKYDVFLSFRGEDTRNGFTSHLRYALERKKIKTYKDDDSLERGDEISTSLLKAIERSKFSVIIFSENYASSSWCLDELVQILNCKNKHGQIVVPVFYGVDPSHVREQRGRYVISSDWFEAENQKLRDWREALKKAAELPGWDSHNTRPDSKLVKEIAKDIKKKLNHQCVVRAVVRSVICVIIVGLIVLLGWQFDLPVVGIVICVIIVGLIVLLGW